jgi:predicted GIY-YIG superfamily endonuclease
MVYIYVLQLLEGKYYVGKTNNPDFRLKEHFNSNGSSWTKLYNPIQVLELIPNCDDYDEDKYTKIYMDKYGIDNVRGGSFVTIKLDSNTINAINKMNSGTNNKCFICGNESHFSADCPKNKNKKDEITSEIETLQNKILELENQKKQKLIDEENAKKGTFEYYFDNLFDFIQMKKEREINRNNYDIDGNPNPNARKGKDALRDAYNSGEDKRARMRKEENKELVPALESIYNSLDIINKRLLKLENNYTF